MKKFYIIGFLALLAVLIYWQYKKAMEFVLKLQNVKIIKASLNSLSGVIYFNLENPSQIGVQVIGSVIDIYINRVKASTINIAHGTTINPRSWTALEIPFEMIPKHILSISNIAALQGIFNPTLEFIGFVKVKKWFLTINIPINIKST